MSNVAASAWHSTGETRQRIPALPGRPEACRCADRPTYGLKVDHRYRCPGCGRRRSVKNEDVVEFICGGWGFRCECGEAIIVRGIEE